MRNRRSYLYLRRFSLCDRLGHEETRFAPAIKLDDSVSPPKPVVVGGQPVMFGAGSRSVRMAIEKYGPLLGLHGHIHESRGMTNLGRTTCVNPGSEYGEGILRGVLITLGRDDVKHTQFTSG